MASIVSAVAPIVSAVATIVSAVSRRASLPVVSISIDLGSSPWRTACSTLLSCSVTPVGEWCGEASPSSSCDQSCPSSSATVASACRGGVPAPGSSVSFSYASKLSGCACVCADCAPLSALGGSSPSASASASCELCPSGRRSALSGPRVALLAVCGLNSGFTKLPVCLRPMAPAIPPPAGVVWRLARCRPPSVVTAGPSPGTSRATFFSLYARCRQASL